MRRHRLLSAAAALALAVGACASLESFAAPEVTLVDVEFTDLTVFETSGVITVRLSNENREPLAIDGAVYNLYLDGLKVGKGLSDRRFELPRLGSAVERVEVHINNLALVTRLIGAAERKLVDYSIKGKLYVERPYGTRRVRFRRQGRLDFSDGVGKALAAQPTP